MLLVHGVLSYEVNSDLVENMMQLFPINVGKLILIGRLLWHGRTEGRRIVLVMAG